MQNFNTYGCSIRCLLEMAQRHGREISEQEVLKQFGPRFPIWLIQPGIVDLITLCAIARELGIASQACITTDQDEIIRYAALIKDRKMAGLLVNSERKMEDAKLAVGHHTMLLLDADANGFRVWSPLQNGAAQEIVYTWIEWRGYFMNGVAFWT